MIKSKIAPNENKIKNWIDELKKEASGKLIIVSSKRAKEKLEFHGLQNVIVYSDPHYTFLNDIAKSKKDCILLLNVSKSSDILCERLRAELQRKKINVNCRFRKIMHVNSCFELGKLLE